ncbi:MAG: hypothetical protein ATN36_03155 [Epulopiscium sp. Nele67-Bin005]|nr:MAG: hypothetical protein ATN36_03155 [Epulopiscium sp. Nele67-Bin005]
MFKSIIGHEQIKSYFEKAIVHNNVAQSYIFEGKSGIGKKSMAKELAKTLLCPESNFACNNCNSCYQIDANTHPDWIVIEKDTQFTKIETVRQKVVNEMNIKPYQSKYKIIMISEAETLTPEGQNALLKTIEEPPSYGIVILVTENRDKLLPTIKSRCTMLRFNPLIESQINKYLQTQQTGIFNKEVYVKFCDGSIGMLQKMLDDETFIEHRKQSIAYLKRIETADMIGVYSLVNEIVEEKEKIMDMLNFWFLFYRDVAFVKSMETSDLYFLDYKKYIKEQAANVSFYRIGANLDAIQEAKNKLNKNVYGLFVMENLLLSLKNRSK